MEALRGVYAPGRMTVAVRMPPSALALAVAMALALSGCGGGGGGGGNVRPAAPPVTTPPVTTPPPDTVPPTTLPPVTTPPDIPPPTTPPPTTPPDVPPPTGPVSPAGDGFRFWDGAAGPKGNNAINGGNGVWQAAGSSSNWTDAGGAINAAYSNGSFAVFQDAPGTVTVDASNGDVTAAGMQFSTYGYVVQGDAIHLVGSDADPTHSVIQVGDGTADGIYDLATINNVLAGDTTLVKTDLGKLVLAGTDTYSGGTTISAGILQVGNGGTMGSVVGDVTNNAALAFNRSDNISFGGVISGSGTLTQAGTGKLAVTGLNTYAGGTFVTGGTLEFVPGASLGAGDITVGSSRSFFDPAATLQIDDGVAPVNRIVLQNAGILDNAGAIGGNFAVGVNGVGQLATNGPIVRNHDSGSIHGSHAGVSFDGTTGSVENHSGGLIEGGDVGVELAYGGSVANEGAGSVIRSMGGTAIVAGSVSNRAGAAILSGGTAIDFRVGGGVINDGVGSSITSMNGVAVNVLVTPGGVQNTGGGTISGATTAIYLEHGGNVVNSVGSTIESTASAGGACTPVGKCAIFVASGANVPGRGNGELTLANAGTIIGNVQMIGTAINSATLSAGGSIKGDLDIGLMSNSHLALVGSAGTTKLYSQAVTGKTTFAGYLDGPGAGTWVIDNDDLKPSYINMVGGTLQVGTGGTQGSLGQTADVAIYHGNLVFDRSDNVTYKGSITGGYSEAYDGTLVQAGTGTLSLTGSEVFPTHISIERGTLQIGDLGDATSPSYGAAMIMPGIADNGSLVFNHSGVVRAGSISGTGSITQNGSSTLILGGGNTYTGGTTINAGLLASMFALPGDASVNQGGILDGASGGSPNPGLPGVTGNLRNAGKVLVHGGDSNIGGDYAQTASGRLAINLGSKLAVSGAATLGGGTLEITGADPGYVSNAHTNVVTAAGGLTGTFGQLIKDTGVVFTSTTVHYDANNAWLDTTGLNVTTAAAGNGVTYTPASLGSAQRVQGAFTQLDNNLAATGTPAAPTEFVQAAGQFQQAPNLQAAQASLRSLSGQLHAASAAMTFEAIDASSRALADHFDDLLGKNAVYGTWMHNLSVGGDMGRAGYDGVGFQLNGWLVGNDMKIGSSGVAGFAFGQSRGQQQLDQSYDHNRSRSTEAMFYAGWLNGNWYTQGRFGVGHFQQDVSRRLLLGSSAQGVSTDYAGNYNVAYGESGLHLDWAGTRVSPFISAEYASIDRGAFAEEGAGGFGLRAGAQTLDRTQAGLGMRAAHHWTFDGGRSIDFNASAQFQRTLASRGDVFDASFVGIQQWQPLTGIGLSRYRALLNVGVNAALSERTSVNLGYDYQKGQRDEAQMMSARWVMAL
jgi:autotransporter-associated beta strand protein